MYFRNICRDCIFIPEGHIWSETWGITVLLLIGFFSLIPPPSPEIGVSFLSTEQTLRIVIKYLERGKQDRSTFLWTQLWFPQLLAKLFPLFRFSDCSCGFGWRHFDVVEKLYFIFTIWILRLDARSRKNVLRTRVVIVLPPRLSSGGRI